MPSTCDGVAELERLIQIVPELAPEIGGVAGYAELLARALVPHGFETLFLAPSKPGRANRQDLLQVEPRPGALAAALRQAAAERRPHAMVLHYVGYGFDRRGCPGWLVRGLERAGATPPLLAIFHETWVSGPPWTHRFWLLPRQQDLVRRLARLSRQCVATTRAAGAALRDLVPEAAARTSVLPTPSTLGEPARSTWPRERQPQVVVLGLPAVRNRVYTAGREALLRFCKKARIEAVHDVGPPIAGAPPALAGLPVQVHGALPAAEVGRFLLESRVLAVHYPRAAAAKSTLVAAGMASGCAVLNCAETEPPDDGVSLWRPATWDGSDWRQAADEAYELYCSRRSWRLVASELALTLR